MNYSDDLKVVWITPMRTGTRSSGSIMHKLNFNCLNHLIKIPEGKEDYFVICNVRNPYSRLVSLYNMYRFTKKNFDYDFESWIKKDHFILMDNDYNIFLSNRIKGLKKLPSKLIRLENFVDDILSLDFVQSNYDFLKNEIETNLLKNQYINEYVQEGLYKKYWKDYYTPETAEIVQKKLKNDFDFLNYDINSWL